METVFTLHRGGSDNPEYLFAFVVSDEDRPLTYAENFVADSGPYCCDGGAFLQSRSHNIYYTP